MCWGWRPSSKCAESALLRHRDLAEREAEDARDIALQNLLSLVDRYVAQPLVHDLLRAREGRLGVGVVVAPTQAVDTDVVPFSDTERVILEAAIHIAAEEVAGPLGGGEAGVARVCP